MARVHGSEFVRRYRLTRGRAAVILISADPGVEDMAAELQVLGRRNTPMAEDCATAVVRLLGLQQADVPTLEPAWAGRLGSQGQG